MERFCFSIVADAWNRHQFVARCHSDLSVVTSLTEANQELFIFVKNFKCILVWHCFLFFSSFTDLWHKGVSICGGVFIISKMMMRFQTLLIFFFEKVLPEALCAYFPFFRHGKFPVLSTGPVRQPFLRQLQLQLIAYPVLHSLPLTKQATIPKPIRQLAVLWWRKCS